MFSSQVGQAFKVTSENISIEQNVNLNHFVGVFEHLSNHFRGVPVSPKKEDIFHNRSMLRSNMPKP
jgi:hypothetical protein